MKFLFVLALVVAAAWFAPAPLAHVEGTVEIAAPRDKVWTLLADLAGARHWDAQMKDAKVVSQAATGEGAERAGQGAVVKLREKVVEWVPYNRVAFDVVPDPRITKFETSRIVLLPSGASNTRVTWTIDYQPTGGYLGDLADKVLFGSIHQGRIDDGLARLERYAETGEVLP